MDNIQETLKDRGFKYGDFKDQSKISQELKNVIFNYNTSKYNLLSEDKKEALEMIFSKIARILNGDPEYKDSWVDIAGYATLVANTLRDEGK